MPRQPESVATPDSDHVVPSQILCPSCVEAVCLESQKSRRFFVRQAIRYCELCRLIVSSSAFAKLLVSDPLRSYSLSLFAIIDFGLLQGGDPLITWTDEQVTSWARSMAEKPSLFKETSNYIPGWLRPARSDLDNFPTGIVRSVGVHSRLAASVFGTSPVMFKADSITMRAGDSDESVACLRRWFDECDQDHAQCHSKPHLLGYLRDKYFPSPVRFIMVDGSNLRLVEKQEDIPKYFAVSHRWGLSETYKTTMENLDSHRAAIPMHLLPKTFRDAFHLAARLQVSYVWIDSLCIVQDDESDWLSQSKQMGQIFESAYLTLAAVDARVNSDGADHGLFMARDMIPLRTEITSTFQMSYNRIDKGDDGQLVFYKGDQGDEAVDIQKESDDAWQTFACKTEKCLSPFRMCIENSDWNSRGWVFQERMLSSRIVYFTKEQLFWECREHLAAEHAACTSVDLPDQTGAAAAQKKTSHTTTTTTTARLHQLMRDAELLAGQTVVKARIPPANIAAFGWCRNDSDFLDIWPEHRKFRLWWLLAERYSECLLTKKSDKWWALAGLATSLSHSYASAIHAGIWESAPAASLLWHVRDRPLALLHAGDDDDGFVAPSWSWLGRDGPISYGAYRDHSYPKLIQKVQAEVLREVDFQVVECAKEGVRAWTGSSYGFKGTISFVCPAKKAVVSDMRFDGFSFSEATGRHGWDRSAAEFLDEVTGGRSGMEMMVELRVAKLPGHTRLLLDAGGGGRAIGWVVLDGEDTSPGVITCAVACARVLKGKSGSERQVAEVLALVKAENATGDFRRVGRGRIVEDGWLKDAVLEKIRIE